MLFVTAGLDRGGAEGFLVRLTGRLAARGHVCAVVSLGARAPLAGASAAAGVAVTPIGRGVLIPSWRLARMARDFRPDVIQGWMYRGNLAACLAARAADCDPALVWSIRQGLNDLTTSPALTRLTVRWNALWSGFPRAIVYNATSAARQHEAAGFRGERTCIIPNGIDAGAIVPSREARDAARTTLGLGADVFTIGLFARWHPVKNHRGFVQAAASFARRHPGARFVLAGAGVDPSNRTLAAWLTAGGVADNCQLLGERADVPALLPALDIATLASHGEALPNTLLEAMAAGIPCVAPDVGDIAALIGPTGEVVTPGDHEALAAGWERLAALPDTARRKLGAQARARVVERYDLDSAARAFEALYAGAASAGR